jgi:P27 family predicted phage terminase small subunit
MARGGGPKPKPTVLHKLHGTYNVTDHRRREREPVAAGTPAELGTPAWFEAEHRSEWAQLLRDAPAGVLARIDAAVLEHYVELRVRYRLAVLSQRALDRGAALPLLTTTANGVAISQYVHVIDKCVLLMTRLQAEMGFTPSSRSRLVVTAAPEQQAPEWSAFDRLRDGVATDVVDFAKVRSARRKSAVRKAKQPAVPPADAADQSA